MCFSTSASFGAGIVLSAIGVASLRKAEIKSQVFFSGIPLIFAVQQITEGFVWLALSNPEFSYLRWPSTYFYLFFAQIVWPFWVPFSIFKFERENNRKKILSILLIIGTIVSIYLAYCLITFPVEANIIGKHISYSQEYPQELGLYVGILYIIATIAPPFFSSATKMWTVGTAILISYVMTTIFYNDYIVSVWCFFASIISIMVFFILFEVNKLNKIIIMELKEKTTIIIH